MNFGDLLSDDPTNASSGNGGGTPSHPRNGRISSGPPPGGGGGPGKPVSDFVKGVGSPLSGSRNNLGNSEQRGGAIPESLVDESDPNHNNMFGHVGGLASLSHDLSFLEDMDDDVPIPPGEINLKVFTGFNWHLKFLAQII